MFVTYRVGRKKTVVCFFGVKIIGILMSWFGSSYVVFAIGRLLVGCGQVGFFVSGFVLGMCHATIRKFLLVVPSMTVLSKSRI